MCVCVRERESVCVFERKRERERVRSTLMKEREMKRKEREITLQRKRQFDNIGTSRLLPQIRRHRIGNLLEILPSTAGEKEGKENIRPS